MPDIAATDWSEREDRNMEPAPNGWPIGAMPSPVDQIGRMMMAAIKRWYNKANPVYLTSGTGDDYIVQLEGNTNTINLFEIIRVRIDRSNVGTTPTLKYGDTNVRTIVKFGPTGVIPLASGDLYAGNDAALWYNGTYYILSNPAVIIGGTVQPYSPNLTSWAAISRPLAFDAFVANPTSANLIALVSDETGSGSLVFNTSPTLVTPVLGAASATSINKVALTQPATGATITIPDGVTVTGPAASGTLVSKTSTDTLTNKTFDTAGAGNSLLINGVAASANTGTGAVVRATSPALVTPSLGTPTALVLTNATGLPITGGGTGQATAAAAFDALSPTTTRGDLIFRNATTNSRLAASTAGYLLQTNGAGTDPTYAGFLQAGTGAVTRTWQEKARDMISPKDFGVVGDGVVDDSATFQACVTAAAGRDIFIGGLIIRVTTGNQITVPSTGLVLRGRGKVSYEGNGSLFIAGTFVTTTYSFTATAGQTVFTAADSYTGAYVDVYQQGVLRANFTQSITHDATNITVTFLSGGAALNDSIQIKVTRATAPGMAAFSQVLIGSGVEILTTQANLARAFQLAWPDTGFAPGRQNPMFVMEPGATIRGDTGSHGFANAIWLHGAYNGRFYGEIYGIGANLIGATSTNDMTCAYAVYFTGEWTTSDFRFTGGMIMSYWAGAGSLFSTLEGVVFENWTFLNCGHSAYILARSNDQGLLFSLVNCHANNHVSVAVLDKFSQVFISNNDTFQNPSSPTPFFRYLTLTGASEVYINDNTFRSFVTGANTGVLVYSGQSLRAAGNVIIAADSTSVCVPWVIQTGSADNVIGPNTYQNVDRAADVQAGSERTGLITASDVFITPPGTATTRYNMAGNNWWMDQKWLVVQNSSAQSIPNNTGTSFAYTEVRDPESIYVSGTIAAPAWATRARVRGNLKWAANATGTRFLRLIRGGSNIEMEQTAAISSFDNTAQHSFDLDFAITSGQAIDMQLLQTSGGALNLNTSQMFVLFT
jgi:hypothetical protein